MILDMRYLCNEKTNFDFIYNNHLSFRPVKLEFGVIGVDVEFISL